MEKSSLNRKIAGKGTTLECGLLIKCILFSKNDCGAEDNAVLYVLPESCAMAGTNPIKWLTRALERIRPGMEEGKLVAPFAIEQHSRARFGARL